MPRWCRQPSNIGDARLFGSARSRGRLRNPRNRVALGIGGGGGGEGDVLAGLEREEETLEQMRRASGRG